MKPRPLPAVTADGSRGVRSAAWAPTNTRTRTGGVWGPRCCRLCAAAPLKPALGGPPGWTPSVALTLSTARTGRRRPALCLTPSLLGALATPTRSERPFLWACVRESFLLHYDDHVHRGRAFAILKSRNKTPGDSLPAAETSVVPGMTFPRFWLMNRRTKHRRLAAHLRFSGSRFALSTRCFCGSRFQSLSTCSSEISPNRLVPCEHARGSP